MAENNRILLIWDDEGIARYIREQLIIETGYSVYLAKGSEEGLTALRENNYDLVILKFGMLDLTTRELIQGLKKIDPDCTIVAVSEPSDAQAVKELTNLGMCDFITKPINLEKFFFLVRKGIEMHSLMTANRKFTGGLKEQNITLEKQNILLAKRIEDATKNLARLYEDLRSTYMRTIRVLAQAIDARDHYTHSHSENVAKFAVAIAEEMGLSVNETRSIGDACELHDLGKIGIQDYILAKPASLNNTEWEQIKRHPLIGSQILEPLTFLGGVIDLVRQHHENYDGSGYPEGRKGEDILIGARIIRLADAYEAMCSARSYRKTPFTKEEALLEIKKNSGKQFDPKVVEAFLRVVDRL
jgi:response regulator RpfG family c-di-GMP phosphodiesterase